MHGREGENWKRGRHMWSVPTRGTGTTRTVAGDSTTSTADSFCKAGRKISVGDCALFKPPQDSPPFIGIIRWLTLNKEKNLQLGVNWLYRPAEVRLGKGILLDAAPNEVFYSFHKDEIPAASLLHPCKVAFLPKGAELPPGISSFVCRRVYDIANKCLWWLTDQDYINERQEEVDQLLYKTQIEMHATVQPGGRSPKAINGSTSTSQLKPGSDNVQSATSFASQVRGKKRGAEHNTEPVKRERSSKDDGDSGLYKAESILKSEIAKITEKGGLVDSGGVEKLVQLMQPDRAERKIELINRSMLAGVIAATDKVDCLGRFVQLRGLPVLDEWLQDVHKGRISDGSSPRDGDKSVEEFLLVLLRALDKLPVNINALQMCNIGKSVNHLRSHKNSEIQKKARSLVDTWKKRVEAEMNNIDAKSGSNQAVSWSSRSRLPEVSHGGNRHPGGSSEVAIKSSVTQPSKTTSVKAIQGETPAKSASSSPGPMKSALSPASGKDGLPRYAASSAFDIPSTTARDEKSSSSSQSHNNSQSYSSDHAKTTVFSGKEDARSSTAGSMSVNKFSGGGSRHRKSNNGPGSGVQRETGLSRSSLLRNSASEKISQSGTCEKALDVPIMEGNNQKLIVKIPNRSRSPAQSASGGSFDDPSIMNSRASSPVLSEKHDQSDRNSKEKGYAYRANITSDMNTESWQINDVLTGSDEGDGSPAAIPDDDRCGTGDGSRKLEVSKATSSSSGNELKSEKMHEASFSSINALIESFVKYSGSNAPMSAVDDIGMNLLASVAAGEMSKSDLISPSNSPQRITSIAEGSSIGNEVKTKSSRVDNLSQDQSQSIDVVVEKQGVIADTSCFKDGIHHESKHALADCSGDRKTMSSLSEEKAAGECNKHSSFSNVDLQPTSYSRLETNERSDEKKGIASVAASPVCTTEKVTDGEGNKQLHEKKAVATGVSVDGSPETKGSMSLVTGDKVDEVLSCVEDGSRAVEGSSSFPLLDIDGENKSNVNEGLISGVHTEQKPPSVMMDSECVADEKVVHPSGSHRDPAPVSLDQLKVGKADEMITTSHVNQTEEEKIDRKTNSTPTIENKVVAGFGSAVTDPKNECMEANMDNKEVLEHGGGAVRHKDSSVISNQETEQYVMSGGSKLTGADADADETEECASTAADTSTGVSDMDAKPKFDLNEGFNADDGKYGEPVNLAVPECSAPVHLANSLPFPVSSVSSVLPASITVTAAAKGPFMPLEDLLRSKGELGWKGSAATSAFRPAEPRKVLEMPLGTTNIPPLDATTSKHGRPLLDIDLNVPDERVLEDMACRNSAQETVSTSYRIYNHDLARTDLMGSAPIRGSGGLDLDLNQIDETNDMGQYSSTSNRRLEALHLPVKSPSSGGFPNCEVRRDFDLNNGPMLDEGSTELSSLNHQGRSSVQSQLPFAALRVNNAEIDNLSSWFPSGNTYPAVPFQSILPDRGDQPFPIVAASGPQRILGPPTGGTPFITDIYRGSILSSTPAVPFQSSSLQYPVFPFETSFPLSAATFSGGSTTYMDSSPGGRLCFPATNSQLLGPAGAVSSQYPRPYVVSLPDGSSNVGVENNRKWGRQGLDLNAGPGVSEIEGRDETMPLMSGQLSVASSQVLAEEQARMYQVAGGVLKRKEPEGGWNNDSFRYKQTSWQ